ncbi:hypothetical protein TWF281_011337 [Arthrobotrys megalospora]
MATHRQQAQAARTQLSNRLNEMLQRSEQFACFKDLCNSIINLERLWNGCMPESVESQGGVRDLQQQYKEARIRNAAVTGEIAAISRQKALKKQEEWYTQCRDTAVKVLIGVGIHILSTQHSTISAGGRICHACYASPATKISDDNQVGQDQIDPIVDNGLP